MDGISCGGTKCSIKDRCKKYNTPPGEYQYIDYSQFGSGTFTDNGCEFEVYCGDDSKDYKYFEEIKPIKKDERIVVTIYGDETDSHYTYIKNNNDYYKFLADKYDGIRAKEVLDFLKFLGKDVFLVYRSYNSEKPHTVN